MTSIEEKDGLEYEMGAGVNDVGKGDVIKVIPGALPGGLERIAEVRRGFDSWEVRTESGLTYSPREIKGYGTRVSSED
ncbi:hypothetical protein ACFL0V_03635 [Nanoarchaeota archaeon]